MTQENSSPPPPPRAITARAKSRSWNEKPVRVCVILTAIITLTTIYFALRDIGAAMTERHLIYKGRTVEARVDMIDQYDRKERGFDRKERHEVAVRYTEGKLITKYLTLPAASGGGQVRVGDMVDLRIDPNDPETATLETTPRTWAAALAVVSLLAPLSILLAIITVWQRKRVLAVWQDGVSVLAVVVDSHRSGIAPRSKVVRFTLADDEKPRVHSTLFPESAGELQSGDEFWIIIPEEEPDAAIVAELYA